MDDAFLVCSFHCFGDLAHDRHRLLERHRTSRDAVGKRGPFDELHHQRTRTVGFLEAVDCGDVRMVQRGEQSSFSLQSRDALGIVGERFGENFDGNFAAEASVETAIDLTHPSGAEQSQDLVDAQSSARVDRHVRTPTREAAENAPMTTTS
jgi:hypothetical protein